MRPTLFQPMKRVAVLSIGILLGGSPLVAQPAKTTGADTGETPANPDKPADPARTAFDQAKNLAKANNVVGAETALAALNKAKPNTDDWHVETAQRLMQAAEQLVRAGEPAAIAALANRALYNLTQADAKAASANSRAAAKTAAGFIQDRYLGDRAAAIASYEAAVQLAPTTAVEAREAAERLKRIDEIVKQRVTRGGK